MIIINTYVCGLFYVESQGEESDYGNIKHKSTSNKFVDVYWNNISVFYSSGFRTNPDFKYLLFTNANPPEKCSGILRKGDVEVINLPYTFKPRKGYWGGWQTSFYILDVLEYLSRTIGEDDTVIILDIDIVITRSLERLVQLLKTDGYLGYDTGFPAEWKSNNVSRNDLKNLYEEINGAKDNEVPVYFGGEIYGVHGKDRLLTYYQTAKDMFNISTTKWEQRDVKFNTEEHLFSCVLWKLGLKNGNANSHIKRMWTRARYRNIKRSDIDFSIWHVPAEKAYGMMKLSKEVFTNHSKFWTTNVTDLPQYIGKYVTIPRRSISRYIGDCCKRFFLKLIKKA